MFKSKFDAQHHARGVLQQLGQTLSGLVVGKCGNGVCVLLYTLVHDGFVHPRLPVGRFPRSGYPTLRSDELINPAGDGNRCYHLHELRQSGEGAG